MHRSSYNNCKTPLYLLLKSGVILPSRFFSLLGFPSKLGVSTICSSFSTFNLFTLSLMTKGILRAGSASAQSHTINLYVNNLVSSVRNRGKAHQVNTCCPLNLRAGLCCWLIALFKRKATLLISSFH